tara:strand:+ start:532 stop:726 length:195 start_codon:yes stop_codon:yes gene_type:complete
MCIGSKSSQTMIKTNKPTAKKTTKKRAVGNVSETTTSSPDKKIAKLNNTSGMSNYDTGSNLNIT